ncbi:MAG TPA: SpvB/TcaC N-terminal domain-containing protein, partial [Nitrospira sp.]|nr:SpvB/TcaC N-terminal domain-containing protein [Nitrospira sp.]
MKSPDSPKPTSSLSQADKGSEDHFRVAAPSLSLPKGGGAMRGMGEKFAANPVTGTGSMTVPIATSPGRSGFGPQLALSYDSGAGNGPFGFGWNLSLPAITRKTDKGLPQYNDATESDVFLLSGAEDLVPVLMQIQDGQWELEVIPDRTVDKTTYRIRRYRPRIEGLFARIERWSNVSDATDVFWRSISKDNLTTWYGKTSESRIADPADPSHIFSWLICESHDDKGNAIVYEYQAENSNGVETAQAHERNRTETSRSSNRYLKRIHYGNRVPYFPLLAPNEPLPMPPSEWLFEVVLDYGEHDITNPSPNDTSQSWPVRPDPFSTYRAGFEVRTYRLCQRVLMFHHFIDELGTPDCFVRSTDFIYSYEENPTDASNPILSCLNSAVQSGYRRQTDGTYLKKSLPPLEFEYTKPVVNEAVQEADSDSLRNLPYGFDGRDYQWVDLDGEGLSGVLMRQAEGWYYKRNLSPINDKPDGSGVAVSFGAIERVALMPSAVGVGSQLLDLAGDGQLDMVELVAPAPGFYERTHDENWAAFRTFTSLPVVNWNDPNLRFVDLTGDGHADILLTEDEALRWYPSLAEAGFDAVQRVQHALDDEQGPRLVFADGTESIYLADLSGDGLTDLVRIRNGEVCYWPNLGYGRFGAKVTMDHAPWFDAQDLFDQRRIRLADIDGSGVTDIIYLGAEGVALYFNQSGNSWSPAHQLTAFPAIDNLASIQVVDLLGNGTACLVWASPLPGAAHVLRYIELMGGQKPHLLIKSVNNLGAETLVQYAPSTKFYLADKLAGRPWISKIPFPVHVVERVETYDRISRNRFVTRHAYHHGYFDGIEREFRGFGMVEQWDTEEFA